ncbi:unnamed protein product [Ophioblennius macclurei]
MSPLTRVLLLLLLGLARALPLQEEVEEEEQESDPEPVAISTRILSANNGSDQFLLEGDLLVPLTRNAFKCWNRDCLWQKGFDGLVTIPYVLRNHFPQRQMGIIESALKSFHQVSCIRFVRHTNQRDFLSIESRAGCFSYLGRRGGQQVVSLNKNGCVQRGVVQHELLHALGFKHEHTRSDRDNYVQIVWNNIERMSAYNFEKSDTNNLGVTYDYSSIMHYGPTAFSINGGKTIIPTRNPHARIGQRDRLSPLDIQKLNKLYRC